MKLDLISLSLPAFFLLIVVELVVARLLRRKLYHFADSVTDLSCGILQQVLEVFVAGLLLAPYLFLYEHARITDLSTESSWAWVACFVGVDVAYYWFHRFSHQCAVAWGVHIVHHQSEEYNLTVALRQDAFQPFISAFFYLPLAVLGFPPVMTLTCRSLNTIYQFWIHTRAVGRLGPLEWILNTPSHHRVHHGSNRKYWDKNFAGVFITWDQLFGTFHPEQEEPTYGVTESVQSWNPVWAHVHYYTVLARKVRDTRGLFNKLQVLLRKPGWLPPGMKEPEHPPPVKYDAHASPALHAYVATTFATVLLGTVGFLFSARALSDGVRVAVALLITWTVMNLGVILEAKRWGLYSERLRLGAMMGALCVLPPTWMAGIPVLLGMALWLHVGYARLSSATVPAPASA
ncbi:MAG: sterol desaturase family protein [Myxococcota bacterium]